MPILKRKYDYIKLYCPNGTKCATARALDLYVAIDLALQGFETEHRYLMGPETLVIEVFGVTAGYVATVYDLET